jgi:multidrug efflux system membrane fusion protein
MKRLSMIALAACGAAEPPPAVHDPAQATAPAPVEVQAEQPDFPGVVTSRVQKIIKAEFTGGLEKVLVTQRQRVKAGDIVAKLDPKELQAEADALRAQESSSGAQAAAYAASARAAAQQARTEKILFDKGIQSRNAVGAANARLGEARGQIGAAAEQGRAAKVKRKQLEEQIQKANLPAPISGVITIVKAKEGELLQRGTPIARVFDDSDLVIKFAVPKEHRSFVRINDRVELHVAGLEQPIWAHVETIADEEPPITFAVVTADIDDSKLRPGEIQVASEGRVRIALKPKTTATATPQPQPQPYSPPAHAGANQ